MTYPNMLGNSGFKTPEQLQMEYNNLMQQYQGAFNRNNPMFSYPQTNMQTPALSNKGTYQYVKDIKEVENTPVALDGSASLFFDFDNGVFWSKKYENGQHKIQTFIFKAYNGNEPLNSGENKADKGEKEPDKIKLLEERISKLESNLNKVKKETKKTEVIVDEP